jgi:hypothetical protein
MIFELESLTKAKLLDVVVLSQKNRQPDENPGAKLTISMDLASDTLAMFDSGLRHFLFTKGNALQKQGSLDGMQTEVLTAAGREIGTMKWQHDLIGYNLVLDLGLGTKLSNLDIADCKLSGWRITPKDGGSYTLKVNVESADVSESAFGKLAKLKSRDVQITITAPDDEQSDLTEESGTGVNGTRRGRSASEHSTTAH